MTINLIAEIGINHDGEIKKAIELIKYSHKSGANAIKFQYRNLKRCYSDSLREEIGDQMIKSEIIRNFLNPDQIIQLLKFAKKLDLKVGISFFNHEDINDFNNILDFDFFKVPSVELLNFKLIYKLLSFNKEVLISTGCSTENEIIKCIEKIENYDNWKMLHCISNYPLNLHNSKLGYIKRLKKLTQRIVGYSSHDENWENCLIAATLGAEIIERHITINKSLFGLDHTTSSNPTEFALLSKYLKSFPMILKGDSPRILNQGELLNKQNLGRSIYAKRDILKGSIIKEENIEELNPQTGITFLEFTKYKNKIVQRDILKGEVIEKSHFDSFCKLPKVLKMQANKNKFSLPVRLHDFDKINNQFELENYEFHFSFKEILEEELNARNFPSNKQYSIHLPDYIDSSTIIDPFSQNEFIKHKSEEIINKAIVFANNLQEKTSKAVPIIGSFSMCNSEKEIFYSDYKKLIEKYEKMSCQLLPQWLPPIAWYFGGSVALDVFNSKEDLKWLKIFSINICLDICHFGMCIAGNFVSKDNFEELFELTNHIHLADSIGIDGEGIQIGKGDPINKYFLKRSLASAHTKVLEVWQGHLNSYRGFHEAIKYSLDLINHE
tara:strand:+ start:447 stop:2273 length:1827 start_codon:yes stop_codon:yes gene_type:complete